MSTPEGKTKLKVKEVLKAHGCRDTEMYKEKNRANAKRQRERSLERSRHAWAISHPGNIHPADRHAATSEARFAEKYAVVASGCWEWIAGVTARGYSYPSFWFDGKYGKAHRAAFTMFNGNIPDGACVLHKCDNRICVNPNHLFLGTKKDNAQDMLSKGRGGHSKNPPRGDRRKDSKLTTEIVLDIRRRCDSGESQGSVAKMYGVVQPTIFKIVHRQRWAHI
jgi:hypothetical protein